MVEKPEDWSITKDGPHEINKHRFWLARQLLDSKLSDREAYGIVAHHDLIRKAAKGGS